MQGSAPLFKYYSSAQTTTFKTSQPLAQHMHVLKANVHANPNIGLFIYATDDVAIVGPEAQHLKAEIQEVLQVPVHVTTIAGTSLAGVFLAGNSEHLLVPPIAFEHEVQTLREALDVEVHVFETTHTALGNNLVLNDTGCLAGPMFNEDERERLQELLGLPVHQFSIADIEVVGNSVVHTSKGGIIHRDAKMTEIDMVKDTLKLPQLLPGTANFGQPYVRSGVVANSHGFLIGSASGGPEITNADEALGFIEA